MVRICCIDRRGRRAGAAGFTLVELLVVISIISLLIGILLPALRAARGTAQAAVCSSNIRQLAIANVNYASEYNGHFVPAEADNWWNGVTGGPNLERWHGKRETIGDPFVPEEGPLFPFFKDGELKRCPLFTEQNFEVGFEAGNGGYGYNGTYVGVLEVGDGSPRSMASGARMTAFAEPGRTVMFADTAFVQTDSGKAYLIEYSFVRQPIFPPWGIDSTPSTHFRHQSRANVAWLDGHVDRRELSFTRGSGAYGFTEDDAEQLNVGYFGPQDNSLFDRE